MKTLKKAFSTLLVFVLVLGAVPAMASADSLPGMEVPMLDVPYVLSVRPGDSLRNAMEPMGKNVIEGWNAARIQVGNNNGNWHRIDVVFIGALENHGVAVMVYEDGRIIPAASRRVFSDGEIITMFVDTCAGGRVETYVPFRFTRGTQGDFAIFFDSRNFIWTQFSSEDFSASPYEPIRPIGPDSIHDILYTDSNGITWLTQSFLLGTQQPTAPDLSTSSEWAREDIMRAIETGLVPQALQADYTQQITRAEFTALAVALYENQRGEITGRETFTDTDDPNVQKAAYLGVVQGVGYGLFSPDSLLTREQAAVMLSRLASVMESPLPAEAATFADNAAVSDWAIEAVGHVQAAGIMGGVGYNRFDPQGAYTREQSIVTILRLFDLAR